MIANIVIMWILSMACSSLAATHGVRFLDAPVGFICCYASGWLACHFYHLIRDVLFGEEIKSK